MINVIVEGSWVFFSFFGKCEVLFLGCWDVGFWIGRFLGKVEMSIFKLFFSLVRILLFIDRRLEGLGGGREVYFFWWVFLFSVRVLVYDGLGCLGSCFENI